MTIVPFTLGTLSTSYAWYSKYLLSVEMLVWGKIRIQKINFIVRKLFQNSNQLFLSLVLLCCCSGEKKFFGWWWYVFFASLGLVFVLFRVCQDWQTCPAFEQTHDAWLISSLTWVQKYHLTLELRSYLHFISIIAAGAAFYNFLWLVLEMTNRFWFDRICFKSKSSAFVVDKQSKSLNIILIKVELSIWKKDSPLKSLLRFILVLNFAKCVAIPSSWSGGWMAEWGLCNG